MNQIFDFEKEKVLPISIEQLERTYKVNRVTGEPEMGIYHFALMRKVEELCHTHGYNCEFYDMFAAQNRDKQTPGVMVLPQIEAKYGEKAVEAHILRRVYANIHITDFDDEEHTTNLAVAFHQSGIEVGFGNMVKICHNQCILSPTQYATTMKSRGQEPLSIDGLLGKVDGWLGGARDIIEVERRQIEQLKQIQVEEKEMLQIIGLLTEIRVRHDTDKKSIRRSQGAYPLSNTQINSFTEAVLYKQEYQGLTAWDIYNCATDLYKADRMEIPQMHRQNLAMAKFTRDYFAL